MTMSMPCPQWQKDPLVPASKTPCWMKSRWKPQLMDVKARKHWRKWPLWGQSKRWIKGLGKEKIAFWWIKKYWNAISSLCPVQSPPVFMKISSLETLDTIQKDPSKVDSAQFNVLFFWATLPKCVCGCLTIFDLGGFFSKKSPKSPASGCQASVWPNFFRRLCRTTEAHVTPIVVALTHTNASIQVGQRSPRFPESLEFCGGDMKYDRVGHGNSGP